ncbi:MAG: hypothetical protein ACTSVZ_13385 [Promethearchaeota archaeon]
MQSIEHLESHIDEILEELARRIRESFSMARIDHNFRRNNISLPHDIFNLNAINATQLNCMMYKYQDQIGADLSDDGQEEIYVIINDIKYKMKKNMNFKSHLLFVKPKGSKLVYSCFKLWPFPSQKRII